MAKAPRPGAVRKQNERAAARRTGWKVTVGERSWQFWDGDLGPATERAALAELGRTPMAVIKAFADPDQAGMLLLLQMVWIARWMNGETSLKFAEVEAEWPTFDALQTDGIALEQLIDEPDEEAPATPEG
jgi:hypothetical protein